jgi:hypothetical protein
MVDFPLSESSEAVSQERGEDEGADLEAFDEQDTQRHPHGEPELWQDFPNEEVTQVDLGHEP